jgi:DNA (cytosine-5)-methyltransferase 1
MNFIDLFAGAGGMSEGFIRAGFHPIAHVEMDTAACFTLKTRTAYHFLKENNQIDIYASYLQGQITRHQLYQSVPKELLNNVINKTIGAKHNPAIHKAIQKQLNGRSVDIVIGGPPCQAYSLVGRARSIDGMQSDARNYLYIHYAKYLEHYKPKVFVFENVIGLKSAKKGKYLENMRRLFFKKGYHIQLYEIESNNFGVLQNRKRIIIIGWRIGSNFTPPDLNLHKFEGSYTVNLLFEDLPKLQAGQGNNRFQHYSAPSNTYLELSRIRNGIDILTQHVARPHTLQDREIYKVAVELWNTSSTRLNYNDLPERLKTHDNRHSFHDRFKVVGADRPYCHTIVAHIAKDGHYYIHPDINQNRSITVREAARLQSFPDDFYFEGVKESANRTAAFTQIGNAVPPLMAESIAKSIISSINQLQ